MRPKQADRLDQTLAGDAGSKWLMPIADYPRYLQLETVTKCNAKCAFCPQHEIKREPARMPDETWRRIVDQTRGHGITYRPFLTNEPFVDTRMVEIVRYIKENDPTAKVEFNSNGELLTGKLGRELLDAGVDIMRFSIDGLSRECYEPSRKGVSWQRVYERVPRFLEIWDEGGYRDQCFTEVRMIEVPENRHEISDYRAYWEPRCSEVLITQLYRWPWTGQTRDEVVMKPCLKILDELFFFSNGNATICCWDVHERAVVGNIHEMTIEEIWRGRAAKLMREMLGDGRRDLLHLCSRCDAYGGYDFDRFLNPARPER